MYYVIIREPEDDYVIGFMVGEHDFPIPFKTELEAQHAMKGHIAEDHMEVVEL